MPFGEYVPLADVLPFLRAIEGPGNLKRGDGLKIFEGVGTRFTFLICYEAVHTPYVREGVRAGAELLVNLTYDTWYGRTAEPHQHLMLCAIQAAQLGVPLVRAASTGISAFVDMRGVITHRSNLYQREVLVGVIQI